MSLDAAILGFLGEKPRSGYDLKTRCFDSGVRELWSADQAQIYRTLDRLQSAKLVSVSRKRQTGRPDRKVYALTELGRQTLSAWIESALPLAPPRDPFLLQLYFSADSGDESVVGRLQARRSLHARRLEALRSDAHAAIEDQSASARQAALRDAAFAGAIAAERAAIDWIDDCIGEIRAGGLPAAREAELQQGQGPSTA
jgi:DNA-binding PadR family transcriptional regulator